MLSDRLKAGLVHLYTGTGGVVAFFILVSIASQRFELAFLLLFLTVVIDGTDGFFARRYRVKQVLPWLDGEVLDEAVDFLNYTFLPLYLLWSTNLLPTPPWLWAALILLASMYGFTHAHPLKTHGVFTNLPAIWHVYAFYVFYYRPGEVVQTLVIFVFLLLTVLPVHFINVTRFRWRKLYGALTGLWLLLAVAAVLRPADRRLLLGLSLIFPVFYFVSSLVIHVRWWGGRFVFPENDVLPAGWNSDSPGRLERSFDIEEHS